MNEISLKTDYSLKEIWCLLRVEIIHVQKVFTSHMMQLETSIKQLVRELEKKIMSVDEEERSRYSSHLIHNCSLMSPTLYRHTADQLLYCTNSDYTNYNTLDHISHSLTLLRQQFINQHP